MTEEKKAACLICQDTPGWVFIRDPREPKPERRHCPNGCKAPCAFCGAGQDHPWHDLLPEEGGHAFQEPKP